MSPRHILRLALIAAPLLLAACGSLPTHSDDDVATQATLQQYRQALDKAELCCMRFSEFDFSHRLPDEPKRFVIGPKRPVADFNGSRSWFLAFRLPDDAEPPYDVLLKSSLTGRWLQSSYLFAPSTAVLDAGFRPLRVQDVQLCEYMGWTRATSGAFGHITIDNPRASYLVVYSSANQLSGSTYWEQSPTAFSAESPVRMASSGSFQIPHGPNGVLYVGLLTDTYRGAVENAICGKPQSSGNGVLSTLRSVILPEHGTEGS